MYILILLQCTLKHLTHAAHTCMQACKHAHTHTHTHTPTHTDTHTHTHTHKVYKGLHLNFTTEHRAPYNMTIIISAVLIVTRKHMYRIDCYFYTVLFSALEHALCACHIRSGTGLHPPTLLIRADNSAGLRLSYSPRKMGKARAM